MFFHARRLPDGSPRQDTIAAEVDIMGRHFQEECTWAMGYVTLLERHLYDLKQRCEKCPYRNKEGSGCNDEIPE